MKSVDIGFKAGMVLVLSMWDDHEANMLWLDSTYPVDGSGPGVKRGTCATTSGDPKDVEENHPHSSVTYSNIKYGQLVPPLVAQQVAPQQMRILGPPAILLIAVLGPQALWCTNPPGTTSA